MFVLSLTCIGSDFILKIFSKPRVKVGLNSGIVMVEP